MNTTMPSAASAAEREARLGRAVAARLTDGTRELPHDIGERLRAARVQALARRKVLQPRAAAVAIDAGGAATLGAGWWTRVASVLPLVVLVAGLVAIVSLQEESRVSELAEVDAALLTDDLPPSAYTDPGFTQFLRNDDSARR